MTDQSLIRNFSIIAHIDHGKSTLADRLIQRCGGVEQREFRDQMLDSMDIERERGITIKAQTVRLEYKAADGRTYVLNLMDTPGHVDFAYEVSRSLAACEGSILVVDASQGVEAQTLANVHHAIEANHEIVPVLNKVDLPAADVERAKQQIEDVIGLDAADAIPISAKTGLNIDAVLEALVTRLPPPRGNPDAPLKALLVDSWYDAYLGVVILVRVVDGTLTKGTRIRMMAAGASYEVDRVGVFTPKPKDIGTLGTGEVGFITAGIKAVADCRVGDTITTGAQPRRRLRLLAVAAGGVLRPALVRIRPSSSICASLSKLRLNDASFVYEPESSVARLASAAASKASIRDHPGAAERVQLRPDRDSHRSGRQDPPHQRRGGGAAQPGRRRLTWCASTTSRAVDQGDDPGSRRASGAVLLREDRRGIQKQLTPCRQPRHGRLRAAAQRGGSRLLRPPGSVSCGYASFDYEIANYREDDLRRGCRSW